MQLESDKIPDVISCFFESDFLRDFDGSDVIFASMPSNVLESVLEGIVDGGSGG